LESAHSRREEPKETKEKEMVQSIGSITSLHSAGLSQPPAVIENEEAAIFERMIIKMPYKAPDIVKCI